MNLTVICVISKKGTITDPETPQLPYAFIRSGWTFLVGDTPNRGGVLKTRTILSGTKLQEKPVKQPRQQRHPFRWGELAGWPERYSG